MPSVDLDRFLSELAAWSERVADAMQPAIEAWERAAAAMQQMGRSLESEPLLVDTLREIDRRTSEAADAHARHRRAQRVDEEQMAAAYSQQVYYARFRFEAELDRLATQLTLNTPLTPEQARSLIQEHGLEFAERVGALVSRGWDCDRAVEALTGRLGRFDEAAARIHLGEIELSQVRFDTGALQATPQHFSFGCREAARITYRHVRVYPQCSWPPRHGTPSSFVEVCSDEAAAKHQPVLTPCATCRNHDDNPYLSCAIHPLERPGHECSDWEESLFIKATWPEEWVEVQGFVNGRLQVVGMARSQ